MNNLKWCLYYTLTIGGHKDIYYIEITENDSTLKAKNLLSKTVFTALIDAMNITDQAMINDNKTNLIKGIKNAIYESGINTLNYNNEYNVIEVTGDIKKTAVKTETIQKRVNDNGVIKLIDCEGIKYNSKLYPNLDLYIVKNENRAHRYHLIEKTSGLAIVTDMKSKQADAIENILANYNMTEKKIIDNFTTLITGKYATNEERKAMKVNNINDNSIIKADNTNILDNTTIDNNAIVSTTDSTTNDINIISNIVDKSYIVGNRCFNTRLEAETYCNGVDFDYSMIIEQNENDNKKVVATDELKKSEPSNRTTENLQEVTDHEKSYTDKPSLYTTYINNIKAIDKQLDILDAKYKTIQENRKSKGLSLAIYKCNDKEVLQLIELDKQMDILKHQQDIFHAKYVKNNSIEYHKQVNNMVKEYNNYKYKVIINHNKDNIQYTNNFHEVIKNCTDKDTIQVLKLIYLNNEKVLPYEILIYNHFINQWNILEENRYYYTDNNYLLEKQLYYNHKLINKFIYRGDNDIMAYKYNNTSMYLSINNMKGNNGVNIVKDNNTIKCKTKINIAMQRYIKGITTEGQELISKIKNKYKNDMYININELIPV